MLPDLPPDILRLVASHLDGLSIVRLETACKAARDLGIDGLSLTVTPKRKALGMDRWLAKHGHRVKTLRCAKCCVAFDTCTRAKTIDVHGYVCRNVPSAFAVRSLKTLGIALGPQIDDEVRDAALNALPNLRSLRLTFSQDHHIVSFRPPDRLERLIVKISRAPLVFESFPSSLRLLTATAPDLRAMAPLPLSLQSVRIATDGGDVPLGGLFGEGGDREYPAMRELCVKELGAPNVIKILPKLPRLERLRVAASVVMVGDELAISSLREVSLNAYYCFAVNRVSRSSVRIVERIPKLVAKSSGSAFDFLEFYGMMVRDDDE